MGRQRHVLSIHGSNDIRLDPVDAPVPGSDDVVVKVKACGVCGSDLGYIKLGGLRAGEVMPIGHEASGEISAVGHAVKDAYVGQRVVINPMMTPGLIGSGGPEGAFTEELLVREAKLGVTLHPIPDDLPYDVAALTEPLAVALHGVNRAEAKPGDRIVVFGCGPIGLGVILWLADRGVTDVIAIDLAEERLARAKALGARATIHAGRDDVHQRLIALHGSSKMYGREVVGTDAFIDAAGGRTILGDVLRMARFQARLVVMAAYHEAVSLNMAHLLTSEITITAALAYPTEMPEVVAALPRIREKAASLISHRFAFEDVIAAFGMAGTPQSAKVMVQFEEEVA